MYLTVLDWIYLNLLVCTWREWGGDGEVSQSGVDAGILTHGIIDGSGKIIEFTSYQLIFIIFIVLLTCIKVQIVSCW